MIDKNIIDKNDKRVAYIIEKDDTLGEYIKKKGSIDYFIAKDFVQLFIYTIIGQLISVKVADKIFYKFTIKCCNDFFPENIIKLSLDDLHSVGMTYKKAEYIILFIDKIIKR